MPGFLYHLGRLVRRGAQKANWYYQSVAGSEAESIRAETQLGREIARDVVAQSGVVSDPALNRLLAELGRRLVLGIRGQPWRFTFQIVAAEVDNAFALPGGFIFATLPLVRRCHDHPDELAFVFAHEMSHVVRRDALNRLLADTAIGAAFSVMARRGGVLGGQLSRLANELLQQGYSQDQELEADAFAVGLLGATGFDPRAAVRLLTRLESSTIPQTPAASWFATHPPIPVRIRAIEKRLKRTQ